MKLQRFKLGIYRLYSSNQIVVLHGADEDPVNISILVEGQEILPPCHSTAKACSLLMGLIYALNLAYPLALHYTFKGFQKLFLELDGFKLSAKVNNLKLNFRGFYFFFSCLFE
uniref:Uncharacterized protein n=1 Tax=Cyprinodon variegatus TaxID=28743 RepID=A0A3Q2DAE0_CYPVA